jgi:hypothetical protein
MICGMLWRLYCAKLMQKGVALCMSGTVGLCTQSAQRRTGVEGR